MDTTHLDTTHHNFWATAVDSEAIKRWTQVLGRSEMIPIKSPTTVKAELPGIGMAPVYLLCLRLLTAEERERLVAYLAAKFDFDKKHVDCELDRYGCPILADTVRVVILNFQRWV